MCRINGIWDFAENSNGSNKRICQQMRDTMAYGGPDAAGYFSDQAESLHLGHRRLSIIDLSEAGNQPMSFSNFIIAFNGEIYNFQALRKKLIQVGRTFQTTSDTEVVLQAWEEWGDKAVEQFHGMFAFAIWDIAKKKLTLCRDRLGVKPLYWYWKDDLFMFASELKALHQHPSFDKKISPKAVSLFLQQGYIQAPHCIFEYAQKLMPGSFLEIDEHKNIRKWNYWDIENIYRKAKKIDQPFDVVKDKLEKLLTESFQLRMVADVPVGLFLSGGIDSSLLASILQKNSSRPLQTFTVGLQDPVYNEAPHAKTIAKHLGTNHTELYIKESDIVDQIHSLSDMCDEPLGDTSIFPTHLVSKLARQDVTVSLSADGADELFGGYTRHEVAYNQFSSLQKIPKIGRQAISSILGFSNPDWLEANKKYIPFLRKYKHLPHKIHKLKQVLKTENVIDFFLASGAYNNRQNLQSIQSSFYPRYDSGDISMKADQLISTFGLIDIQTYLEGNILPKVDRASMQVALEARDPFMDHKIIEFAFGLPDQMKIQGKSTKHILRQILYQYVPKEMIERPKQGFTIPMHQWLKTHFREELNVMIEDANFADAFAFNHHGIKIVVQSFLNGPKFVDHHLIWFLFVLFQWKKRWLA